MTVQKIVNKILNELKNELNKKENKCIIENDILEPLIEKESSINFSDLNLIFNDLKKIFEKQGYIVNWNELEKQSMDQTINTLSMASPFSKEEKQMLLEAKDLTFRKQKLEEIIKLYNSDNFSNKTLQ